MKRILIALGMVALLQIIFFGSSSHDAYAAISFVNATSTRIGGAPTVLTSTVMSVTTGNFILLGINQGSTTRAVSSVIDTAGNTYSLASFATGTAGTANQANRLEFWYAANVTGNAANMVTVTWTGPTSGGPGIAYTQYSGVATVSPLDATSTGNTGSSTVATSSVITTSLANDLIAVTGRNTAFGLSTPCSTNFNVASPFTVRTCGDSGGWLLDSTFATTVSTSSQTTFTGGTKWTVLPVAFKAAVAVVNATNASDQSMAAVSGIFQANQATFTVAKASFQVQ